jgi:hypothetical protein
MKGVVHNPMYQLLIEAVPPTETYQALMTNSIIAPTAFEGQQSLDMWHHRLLYTNHTTIQQMVSQGIVDGITLKDKEKKFCPGCSYGKQHRNPFPVNENRERSATPRDLIHTDLCGPISTPSMGGAKYFVLFKDDSTGYKVVECIKTKPDILAAFKQFVAQIKQETGNSIKVLRNDRRTEFTNKAFTKYMEEQGIKHEMTTTYTP